MDLFNTWMLFNVAGCAIVIGYTVLSSAPAKAIIAKASGVKVNLAGISGMAMGLTSVSLVAQLFTQV
jgi:predicted aminopeptidase